ncbi:hypothetical protein NL50_06865 [Clostridium acetobutylicum]|nr:hypothetical protein NL50_06865 [Clostridium acetobutylicum]
MCGLPYKKKNKQIYSAMLRLRSITWKEFMAVFQGTAISIYVIIIFASIFLSYWISSKSVKQNNIIEAMKDEVV